MRATDPSRRDWSRVDFYAVLGVAPGAGPDEIDRAFRDLAKRLHPDRTGGASSDPSADRFKEVTAAYEVLGDAATRVRYDDLRSGLAPPPDPVPLAPVVGGADPRTPAHGHAPERVVSGADPTARDITLWIVSVKLLVGGTVFTVVGARRLR